MYNMAGWNLSFVQETSLLVLINISILSLLPTDVINRFVCVCVVYLHLFAKNGSMLHFHEEIDHQLVYKYDRFKAN